MTSQTFDEERYDTMPYRPCGRTGLHLPAISLGCWHNFTERDLARDLMTRGFDLGITHFDLANNYGPPPGQAETIVGEILNHEFKHHRDELIISSKAGYRMWPGPYGEFGSRKSIIASCDASLKRLQLDYVDIFYSHRPDPASGQAPLDETIGALDTLVKQGKALYAGVSSYSPERTAHASDLAQHFDLPLAIHQPAYNMINRGIESQLVPLCGEHGVGIIAFCPLAQGLLTDRYLNGIPEDSRAKGGVGFLKESNVTEKVVSQVRQLQPIAEARGQSIAQLAISWILRDSRITSVLCGASKVSQLEANAAAATAPPLSDEHLKQIDDIFS